jgi:hypothetical protein
VIPYLQVCGFPALRQKKGAGWGTGDGTKTIGQRPEIRNARFLVRISLVNIGGGSDMPSEGYKPSGKR